MIHFALLLFALLAQDISLNCMHHLDLNKNIGLPILTSVELRKKQLHELEEELSLFIKTTEDANKSTAKQVNKINFEINDTYARLKTATNASAEILNKKLSLLNDHKQNLLEFQEFWKETLTVIDSHCKLVREFIEFLSAAKQPVQSAYSWKEFRDAQIRLTETSVKIETYRTKRDTLGKKKLAEQEHMSLLAKQLDLKQKDREKLIAQLSTSDKQKNSDNVFQEIKLQAEVLEQELASLHHRIDRTRLGIKKLEREVKLFEDFAELEYQKLQDQQQVLIQIESRLVLTNKDVDQAKSEWQEEANKALARKEVLHQLKINKKQEKSKINSELEYLKEAQVRSKAEGKKNPVEYEIIKAQVRRLAAQLQGINEELTVLDARRDLADAIPSEKEMQFIMVDARYKLKSSTGSIEQLLAETTAQFESIRNHLKNLKDKRNDAISALIETNRQLEKLKENSEELKTTKQDLFKGKEVVGLQVGAIQEETKRNLLRHISLTQELLAVNADLIRHHERLCNQYNLILNDLQNRKKLQSVWKRSAKAISLQEFTSAVVEGENFFKEIFWSTPTFLWPAHILKLLRNFNMFEIFGLILFCLLFILLFFSTRRLLRRLQARGPGMLERYQYHTQFVYLTILFALVDFAIENFALLYTWCFFCIHFAAHGALLQLVFGVYFVPYYRALFFLLSIPILLFLSNRFLATFTKLNETLSYFFFAERLQDRFASLLTIFCYATSVLIPLRAALLQYNNIDRSPFASVVLAAYSLILVCMLLFFFTKQEVLRLLPSGHPVFVWLKRKIETYYYPVFLFIMSLFILSNPYVGYSNLAWYLAFVVPISVLVLYSVFFCHYYVRQYSLLLFMTEDEDELVDKFEHAKAYYSFFVIFSFIFMFLATLMMVSHIWGLNYSPTDVWKLLSDDWVLHFGVDKKVGLIQFFIIGLCLAFGFLISSLLRRFVLSKLFEILRSEAGTQNTVSRVLHYFVIFIAFILGLSAIHLEQFIFWVGASLSVAVGWMLKDMVADLVSGLFILLERPLEIGNYVQVDNIQGFVQRIAARTTTIITPRNHSIIIPNSDLLRKPITNWGHGRFAVGFEIQIRVEHSCDPELVKRVLISVIQANPTILKAPNVMARLEDVEENALYFITRAFISARRIKEQWEIAANIRTEIWKAFKEHRISFAKPVRMLAIDVQNPSTAPKAIEFKFGA